MIMAITDTTDIWEKTQEEIKDLIQVRLEEVTKKKNFDFKEFHIMDMVKLYNECEHCFKGRECKKHKLGKQQAFKERVVRPSSNSKGRKKKL